MPYRHNRENTLIDRIVLWSTLETGRRFGLDQPEMHLGETRDNPATHFAHRFVEFANLFQSYDYKIVMRRVTIRLLGETMQSGTKRWTRGLVMTCNANGRRRLYAALKIDWSSGGPVPKMDEFGQTPLGYKLEKSPELGAMCPYKIAGPGLDDYWVNDEERGFQLLDAMETVYYLGLIHGPTEKTPFTTEPQFINPTFKIFYREKYFTTFTLLDDKKVAEILNAVYAEGTKAYIASPPAAA